MLVVKIKINYPKSRITIAVNSRKNIAFDPDLFRRRDIEHFSYISFYERISRSRLYVFRINYCFCRFHETGC